MVLQPIFTATCSASLKDLPIAILTDKHSILKKWEMICRCSPIAQRNNGMQYDYKEHFVICCQI